MMAENKTQATALSVDDFIAQIENKRRREDALVLLELYKGITQEPAVMWGASIIGFGTSHYRYESGREGVIAAASFSPRKANLTLYLCDEFDGAVDLYARLGKHKKSVACVYINKLADIDLTVLAEIIAKDFSKTLSTQHRVS
jgi:hypothetical protein